MSYTVAKGDTLSSIATKLGVSLADLEKANPMGNFNKIAVGQNINVPGAAGAAAAPAGNDPNSQQYQNSLSEYGAVAVFAQSNPEVNTILQQAIAGTWDAARFERALWNTNWYKSLSDQQQQLQVQQATDPGQYNAQLQAMQRKVTSLANQTGIIVDASAIAQQALWNGWDDNTLQHYIAHSGSVNKDANGAATANIGDYENQVRNTYASYGIDMGSDFYEAAARRIAGGEATTGGYANQAISQASKFYPQFAQDFTEGRTLSQIAAPLMQQMGTTLEIDPSSITLNDPTIQKALAGDGKNVTPLYAFNQMLKQDPRWQKTDNAKNAAYDTISQIGKDFGFSS